MSLTIRTAMTNGIVDGDGRNMLDAMEIVHTVLVGNVFLTAENVDDRRMKFL